LVLQGGQDGGLPLGAGDGSQGGQPVGRARARAGHAVAPQTRKVSTRCRSTSDSPASVLAATLICSTATRFCRETSATDSTALTISSPPRCCSATASLI